MTPKQQYEARKAERAKLKELESIIADRTETVMVLDMLDRFVTAAERIADALEARADLPDWDDLRGCATDATGEMSSEDFVRELRNEWER